LGPAYELGWNCGGIDNCSGAVIAHALVPEMRWAAAVALGALVARPDGAAATAVLRQLRPPHRILTVLEGESLLKRCNPALLLQAPLCRAH